MKKPFIEMLIGIVAGLIVPFLFGWLFVWTFYDNDLSWQVVWLMLKSTTLVMKLLFIAVLPNMLAVFLLNHFEKWNYCRGVFVAIMLYIIVAVLLF